MNNKARILMKLFEAGKVSVAGLDKALADGTINQDDYNIILGTEEEATEE